MRSRSAGVRVRSAALVSSLTRLALRVPGTGDRDDVLAMRARPVESKLRHRGILGRGQLDQLTGGFKIFLEVAGLLAGIAAPHVGLVVFGCRFRGAGQESAAEGRVRDESDAQFIQDGEEGFNLTLEEGACTNSLSPGGPWAGNNSWNARQVVLSWTLVTSSVDTSLVVGCYAQPTSKRPGCTAGMPVWSCRQPGCHRTGCVACSTEIEY